MTTTTEPAPETPSRILGALSKLLVLATLALIFLGGQVKSHEAGLAVPDWPTTYGYNMFLYPVDQWVGGIFHEHFHRLWASGVGMITVVLCIALFVAKVRPALRWLGVAAVVAVIVQGVLGGLTVRYGLPVLVSSSHATLAQAFLVMTVVLAYGVSRERAQRPALEAEAARPRALYRLGLVLIGLVFVQLFLGALMRHTESGLAIPDFPTTAGRWLPIVNDDTLHAVNAWRFDQTADAVGTPLHPVTLGQIHIHLSHRIGALVVTGAVCLLAWRTFKAQQADPSLRRTAAYLVALIVLQISLGVATIWTVKSPLITSFHVATGAAVLAVAALYALRARQIVPAEASDTISSGLPARAVSN